MLSYAKLMSLVIEVPRKRSTWLRKAFQTAIRLQGEAGYESITYQACCSAPGASSLRGFGGGNGITLMLSCRKTDDLGDELSATRLVA